MFHRALQKPNKILIISIAKTTHQHALPKNHLAFQQGKSAPDVALVSAHRVRVAQVEQQESLITSLDIRVAYDTVCLSGSPYANLL